MSRADAGACWNSKKGLLHLVKVFIPMTDDMLDNPETLEALMPYQPGISTLAQIAARAPNPDQSRSSTSTSPGCTPSSAALPALSSNTYRAGPVLE